MEWTHELIDRENLALLNLDMKKEDTRISISNTYQ